MLDPGDPTRVEAHARRIEPEPVGRVEHLVHELGGPCRVATVDRRDDPRVVDHPGAGERRAIPVDLHILVAEPCGAALRPVRPVERAGSRIDRLGLGQERRHAPGEVRPGHETGEHEIAGVPQVEGTPGVVDDPFVRLLQAEGAPHVGGGAERLRGEESLVVAKLGHALGEGIGHPVAQAVLRLERVALPPEHLGEPTGTAGLLPAVRRPVGHPMHAERTAGPRGLFGLGDDRGGLGDAVELGLIDGEHQPAIRQADVGRRGEQEKRPGEARPSSRGQDGREDRRGRRRAVQGRAEQVGERALAVERAPHAGARLRREEGEQSRPPDLDEDRSDQAEQEEGAGPSQACTGLAGLDAIPAEPGEHGEGEDRQRQEFARIAEAPEARDGGGEQLIETAVAVPEVAVRTDRARVGRVVRAERADRRPEVAGDPDGPGEFPHAQQERDARDPGHPSPPRRDAPASEPDQGQHADRPAHVERRGPEPVAPRRRDQIEPEAIPAIHRAEEEGEGHLDHAIGLEAEIVRVIRTRLGDSVGSADVFGDRKELRGRQRRGECRRRDQSRQPRSQGHRPRLPGPPAENDREPRPGPEGGHDGRDPAVPAEHPHRRTLRPEPRQIGGEDDRGGDPGSDRGRCGDDDRGRPPAGPALIAGATEEDRIRPAAEALEVGELGIAAEDLHRQDHRQPRDRPATPAAQPCVERQESPGRPRRTDQIDQGAILEQDRAAEGIADAGDGRTRRADAERPGEGDHPRERQERMRDHINAGREGIGQGPVDQLARVEDGRRGVAQQGHPAVLLGLPERPPAGVPLVLDLLVERIAVVRHVAEGELLAGDRRAEAQADEQHEADRACADRCHARHEDIPGTSQAVGCGRTSITARTILARRDRRASEISARTQ